MLGQRIAALLLVLVGAVWVLQGLDLLGGSSMTGHAFWAVLGAPMVVVGIVLLRSARRSRSNHDS